MIDVNDSNFNETIGTDKLTLIEFSADWCMPCKALKPILSKISDEDSEVVIGTLDVDDNPDLSIKYNIRNVPTTIFFKDGEEVHKILGNVSSLEFKKHINDLK